MRKKVMAAMAMVVLMLIPGICADAILMGDEMNTFEAGGTFHEKEWRVEQGTGIRKNTHDFTCQGSALTIQYGTDWYNWDEQVFTDSVCITGESELSHSEETPDCYFISKGGNYFYIDGVRVYSGLYALDSSSYGKEVEP